MSAATQPRPLPTCLDDDCDGELVWTVEITNAAPWGTGFDLLVCEACGEVVARHFVGF